MPNWADCRLWVDGDEKTVADFFSKVISDDDDYGMELDYNILVPLNEEGTYDYNLANAKWGTKWCGSDVRVVDCKQVEFQSPWSGPDTFVSTVSEMYPDLTFELTCVEAGCDFSYKNVYQNGICTEIDGGTFTVLCEEFGYQVCDNCGSVCDFGCECNEVEEEAVVVEGAAIL